MKKYNRNITVIIYLLKKLHRYACQKQNELYQNFSRNDEYLEDCRITAFGLLRTILFCAINDAYNLQKTIVDKKFLTIRNELNESFPEQFLIIALENYPIYNYIIRFQSIVETSTRKFLSPAEFGQFSIELNDTRRDAMKIFKAWRNTIHNNGRIEKEEHYHYRGKEISIRKDKDFEFEFWTLYRISFDLIDVLFEFSKKSLKTKPKIITDHQIQTISNQSIEAN